MQAGLLRDIISIEQLTITRNSSNGEQQTSYAELWKGRAKVTFSSGTQLLENGETVNTITRKIQIRTKPSFTQYKLSNLRITFKGQHYRLLSLDERAEDMSTLFNVELINE